MQQDRRNNFSKLREKHSFASSVTAQTLLNNNQLNNNSNLTETQSYASSVTAQTLLNKK